MALRSAVTSAVTIDTRGMDEKLEKFRKDQLPYAKAVALNALARDTVRVEKLEMIFSFDRPTPYVLGSLTMAGFATKKNPSVAVWFKGQVRAAGATATAGVFGQGRAERIMRTQIEGGARDATASERRLRGIGKQIGKALEVTPFLGRDEYLVAARAAPKNVYGNISPGEYVKMLAYFRAFNEGGFTSNRVRGSKTNARGERYYVQKIGKSRGIFKVSGKKGKPRLLWMIVKKRPIYRPRFDFYGIADRHAAKWAGHFAEKGMAKALATAR